MDDAASWLFIAGIVLDAGSARSGYAGSALEFS
jgi:hypothetical protein